MVPSVDLHVKSLKVLFNACCLGKKVISAFITHFFPRLTTEETSPENKIVLNFHQEVDVIHYVQVIKEGKRESETKYKIKRGEGDIGKEKVS